MWHKSLDHSEKTNSKYAAKMRLRKAGIRPTSGVRNDDKRRDFHIESLVNAGPLTNRMQNPAYSGQGVGQRGVDNKAKLSHKSIFVNEVRLVSRESLAKAFGSHQHPSHSQ